MSILTAVTYANQEQMAKEIEDFLRGKLFSVVTNHRTAPSQNFVPTVLPNFAIKGGFEISGGRMTMLFVPRRKLFWDIETEKVTISIGDMVVNVSRVRLDNSLALYRTIVVSGPISS